MVVTLARPGQARPASPWSQAQETFDEIMKWGHITAGGEGNLWSGAAHGEMGSVAVYD